MAAEQALAGHRDRLRRRFLAPEDGALDDADLLELLLCYAIPRKDVRPLATRLLTCFGSLHGVLAAERDALRAVDGVGESVVVLCELVHRLGSESVANGVVLERRGARSEQPALFDQDEGAPRAGATRAPDGMGGDMPPNDAGSAIAPPGRTAPVAPRRPPNRQRGTDLFGKAALAEAIALLPALPDTDSLTEVGRFLCDRLPFNAAQTRQRQAEYIMRRMFPSGSADRALRAFARRFADTPALRDACYYRFYRAEPFMRRVTEEVLLPHIGGGVVARQILTDFVTAAYPQSRSVREAVLAIIAALVAGGIATADRRQLRFAYRDIPLPAFAFVLHSAFPEPGIHDLARLEDNAAIRGLLWQPQALLPALYELRNRGLVVKVSEIDRLRQFTTRYTLEQAVDHLLGEQS